MSTGLISAPLILEMSPKCVTLGNRFVVTRLGKISSLTAHLDSIPESHLPSGKPPEPSKRLPKVKLLMGSHLTKQT